MALPDHLQLRRRVPPRDQHHPRHPGGLAGRRGALGLSGAGPRRLIVRTDGAARGNPGPASAGAVLIDADAPGASEPDAPPVATVSEALGRQTNNVAEYTGVVRALALAEELGAEEVALLLDSMLIVEQLRGRWRVKDAKLIPLHADALARLRRFRSWSARHVPRSENRAADALANEALDRVAAGGPAVVIRRPGEGIRSESAARLLDAPVDAVDVPAGRGAGTQRAARRDQLPLGLEPGFDPGDPGPEAGELRVRILGSGTSQGLPRIACDCATCASEDPRDRRLRASALLAWGARRVIIDCSPDFRAQALAADLDRLDAVLLSHEHHDAIGGLDDLRPFNELEGYLSVYGLPETLDVVVRRFAYAFEPGQGRFRGIPMLRPVPIAGPWEIAGRRFVPVPVEHGALPAAGFRSGGFGYVSDVNRIEAPSLALLRDLDVLVLNAVRDTPHPAHQTVDEALAVVAELRPRRTFLTHLDHELRHAELSSRLPAGVEIAVDGLELRVPR